MGFIHSIVQQTDVSVSTSEQKNWRGIVISILVICFVLALIVVAIFLVSPKKFNIEAGEPFSLEEICSEEFQPKKFEVHWLPTKDRNVYLYRSEDNELLIFDADKNQTEIVINNSTFRELNTDVYLPSPDYNFILIAYDVEKVKDSSYRAKYKIFHRNAEHHKTRFINFPDENSWENRKLDLVLWSPNSQSLSFVYERRLYLQPDPFSSPIEVATNNDSRHSYYGIANALYEEEILGDSVAHWWSTKGSYLCYLVINDSNVPVHRYPVYGSAHRVDSTIAESAYPKAGLTGPGQLPAVSVYVTRASNPHSMSFHLRPPSHLEKLDHFVTNVAWADDLHVAVVWMNRYQNRSIVVFCDAKIGHCRENLVETVQRGREWLTPMPVMRLIDYQQAPHTFLTLMSKRDGAHGYWRHVAKVSLSVSSSGARFFLTDGLWEATDIVGFDSETDTVYFIATEQDPRSRHLYSVTIPESASGQPDPPVCLTCRLSDQCQYVHASFSPSGKFYVLHCLGPGLPTYTLVNTFNDDVKILEDNYRLGVKLKAKAMPITEFYQIDSGDGQKTLVQLLLPPLLQKEQIYIYPTVLIIDEWPGSQLVTWKFRIDFSTYLTTAENAVVVMADGRGSAGKGDKWHHSIRNRIGIIDLHDQIKAAVFVRDSFHYIDKERIAVIGKSYGGYLAVKALGNESNIFRCGTAISPITNWKYFSSLTAERLLGPLHDDINYKVYNDAQLTIKPEFYRGKHLLLVHGTADEKVHFDHTAQLVKHLTEADVDFNVQLYTDAAHSLDGVLRHAYYTAVGFWKSYCWSGGKPRLNSKKSDEETTEQK